VRIRKILAANLQKLEDGHEQLLGSTEASTEFTKVAGVGGGEVGTSSNPRFTEEDASLLLVFAGIEEIDEEEASMLCYNSLKTRNIPKPKPKKNPKVESKANANAGADVATSTNTGSGSTGSRGNGSMTKKDPLFAAAVNFVEAEERGEGGISNSDTSTGKSTGRRSPNSNNNNNNTNTPAAEGDVDFSLWSSAVLASLRHKLLAGVLAERRGHLAPNFMDHAEKSSTSMHSMAPSATGSSHSHSLTHTP